MVLLLFMVSGSVGDFYTQVLSPPLEALRENLGIDIWPHHWPLLAQMFALFFLNELLWYGVHRAEHQFSVIWRVSGHGAHHAFQKLGALNFGLNHPLEYFFLLLPGALLELTFGIGAATLGASLLLITQASIAHCNVAMNSRVIGWLFTTNQYHICHHSLDLVESNTNFGCAAIVWDRVFGTFSDNRAMAVGSGPIEPSTWHKLIMPIKEYEVSDIAPGASQ
jgi:sterol desaturase/sphingolipid hydroxylase (fatty acid hydroxylase superfamily)